jgi:NADPH:quinone reductase-like Zn-dependent oxidoreductase
MTMKALRLDGSAAKPLLAEQEITRPQPGPGEVLVRVRAVAVTPTELLWYPTTHNKDGSPREHAVPGHEFSGEVAEVGEGVAEFSPGDAIYGINDWFADGALAEYCVTRPEWIAPKPNRLTYEEAASVPISALTAWQGLLERARLQRGERLLVHGGAGAVGSFAIQIAKAHGAQVITTVSAVNAAFVKELGADEAIDYRTTAFEDRVRDVDVVFDTVGGDTLRRSWQVLKPGGRMVTVAADSESSDAEERVKQAFFIVEANSAQLRHIGALLDSEELRSSVDTVLSVAAAADAFAGKLTRRGHGKLVISTSEWAR